MRRHSDALTVSVVIPTHARVAYLEEAIQSVLLQTQSPIEVIVVSDVEDDNTNAVVERLTASAAIPIRLLRNFDRPGASGSRNTGAEVAKGDVIAFLDDDDLWTSRHLQQCIAVLIDSDIDLCVSGIELFNDERSWPGIQLDETTSASDAGVRSHGVTGSNILIRATSFESIGGFDPKLPHMNDRDFFYRCLLGGLTFKLSPEMTARYRKHSLGQLTGASDNRARGIGEYLRKHASSLSWMDRRQLRYETAVMRYRASKKWYARILWLAPAALNARPSKVVQKLRRHGDGPVTSSQVPPLS